jgi:hypothetical protein
MRTRSCRSLRWAFALLVFGVVAGPAAAIGPGPLLRCKGGGPPTCDASFGYVPTVWRPWPVCAPVCAPADVSVPPMTPAEPGAAAVPAHTVPATAVPAEEPAKGSPYGNWTRHTIELPRH